MALISPGLIARRQAEPKREEDTFDKIMKGLGALQAGFGIAAQVSSLETQAAQRGLIAEQAKAAELEAGVLARRERGEVLPSEVGKLGFVPAPEGVTDTVGLQVVGPEGQPGLQQFITEAQLAERGRGERAAIVEAGREAQRKSEQKLAEQKFEFEKGLKEEQFAFQKSVQELKQKEELAAANLDKEEKLVKSADDLRNLWLKDDITKDTKKILSAQRKIENSAAKGTAAGDLAAIFSYMKVLDPGSTVREGEFANVENARGIPETVRNLYNKAAQGTRLTDNQRRDFLETSKLLYQAHIETQQRFDAEIARIAAEKGLQPESVVLDIGQGGGAVELGKMAKGEDGRAPAPMGASIQPRGVSQDVKDFAKQHGLSDQEAFNLLKKRGDVK